MAGLTAGSLRQSGDEWTAAAERIYLNAVSFAATATRGEITGTVVSEGKAIAKATVTVDELGAN